MPSPLANDAASPPAAPSAWKRWALRGLRLTIAVLVVWFLWQKVTVAVTDLQAKGFTLAGVRWPWIVAAGAFYALGTAPSWWFWHRTLRAMGARPTWRESLRAYFIGHLGKYVPGKALVVIIRAGLVRSERTDSTVAAVAVFIETLSLMAVGAALAAGMIALLFRDHAYALAIALALMLAAGGPTLPPIFRRLVRLLKVRKANPTIEQALEGVDYRLMGAGWAALTLEWLAFALSLWAVLQALPTLLPGNLTPLAHLPLLLTAVSLSMVAGFLSLLPGGIGVRDYFLIEFLALPFSAGPALVAAVLLRLVWLATEVATSVFLYVAIRGPAPSVARPSSADAAARVSHP